MPFTHTVSSSPILPDVATEPRHDILAYCSNRSNPVAPPVAVNAPTYAEVSPPSKRPDRPGLLVSSTSWTPDEDFGILLGAMEIYERRARELSTTVGETERLPKLMVVLTGKGPLREKYMTEVKKLQEGWEWVRCISLWLEAEDYPLLLGMSFACSLDL
jgi:beta-1,4-mannosyltransferase